MDEIKYKPIGVIHTQLRHKQDAPIQGVFAPDNRGEVEVFAEYAGGLKDLEGFSHLFLLYHFHLADGWSLTAKPFLDKEDRGIFSIRHYNRPNPIGISVVRLHGVRGNVLDISEVDILDGTPLLDIKPYVPDFDQRIVDCTGWYEDASERGKYYPNEGF